MTTRSKEITPKSKWNKPLFYKINLFLSLLWGCFFIIELLLQILFYKHIVTCNALQIGTLIVVVVLTKKIPVWMTKNVN